MAISVDAVPSDYSSVHDDLWHVVTSDNSSVVDFKYVIDLFAGNKQLIRAKVFPNPSNGTGYFDASNIVSNEMNFDWFDPNGEVFMKELNDSGEIYQKYQYRIGEDVSGITTLNMASGEVLVANCIPNLFSRRIYPTSSFLDNTIKKFYTNRDKLNIRSKTGEDLYIGISAQSSDYLRLKQYKNDGSLLSTHNITIPITTLTNIFQLNISPTAFIDYGITFASNCVYYELQLSNDIMALDKVRIYFECAPKYDVINLHFMNNYGLFDTARFGCVSRLSMDAQRKTFEKPDYRFGNSVSFFNNYELPNDRYGKQYYESKINYGSQYQWNYKLTMNFPNDSDYQWLAELIMSPQVWAEIVIDDLNKEYYPVSIKATNYEYSKHINNGLKAFEVEIDMNQKRNGFRR
jgi:hypothetical protein